MKKIAVLLLIGCLCTACGAKEDAPAPVIPDNSVEESADETEETEEESQEAEKPAEEQEEKEPEAEETTEPDTEAAVVYPLPTGIQMDQLEDCTLAVSFDEGDAYVDDSGAMQLDVTVYTYDLYDMVDMAQLEEGDTINLRKQDVLVEKLERTEHGAILINGGLDEGGYELISNDSGVFFETGYSDVKEYYELGKATLRVSPDFTFVDSSDLDQGEITYYPGDFLTDDAGIMYYFNPNNTTIVVEDGMVIAMERVYTP